METVTEFNTDEVARRLKVFALWVRTGEVPPAGERVETGFKPWQDPEKKRLIVAGAARSHDGDEGGRQASLAGGVCRPDGEGAQAGLTRRVRRGRGGSIGPFQDPMTLEQSFPGLAGAPSGAVIGLANDAVDFFFGRGALTAGMSRYSNIIFAQIKAIDPDYRYDSLGAPSTHEGWTNQLNDMRFDRVVAFMRKLREIEPMKLETLRLMQRRADIAYEAGLRQLRAGKLNPRLSNEEALGNFVDREVRKALRDNFRNYGINEESDPVIRVNRRENSVSEKSYRRPDARVGDAAFDVTLTRKNLATPQVRGFFNADFRPEQVIIIRPRQLSPGSSYIITRPE